MTKQEVMEKLDEAGVKYDKRLKVENLEKLLPTGLDNEKDLQSENKPDTLSEEVEKAITESIMQTSKVEFEKTLSQSERTDDGAETKSGIIIPQTALIAYRGIKWVYYADHYSDKSVVIRKQYPESPKYEEIRTYTLEIHGENFKKLAEQFVDKNNR